MQTICNFYVLKNARENGRFLFCCALIEKLYGQGHRVYVHCQDADEATHFNELLWTYKDISFIPHSLSGEYSAEACPIQIGFGAVPKDFNVEDFKDTLIFLSVMSNLPALYQNFSRIVEIVDSDPTTKTVLREHYQQYRAHGIEIKTHQI